MSSGNNNGTRVVGSPPEIFSSATPPEAVSWCRAAASRSLSTPGPAGTSRLQPVSAAHMQSNCLEHCLEQLRLNEAQPTHKHLRHSQNSKGPARRAAGRDGPYAEGAPPGNALAGPHNGSSAKPRTTHPSTAHFSARPPRRQTLQQQTRQRQGSTCLVVSGCRPAGAAAAGRWPWGRRGGQSHLPQVTAVLQIQACQRLAVEPHLLQRLKTHSDVQLLLAGWRDG
jgi:hypothetical protein